MLTFILNSRALIIQILNPLKAEPEFLSNGAVRQILEILQMIGLCFNLGSVLA